jgi:cellulose synthase/poly-beta-1,6-N-acetylglucosamine synthase-like glycosyltransferase
VIIQIVSNLRRAGYLEKGPHPAIAPFFAGANTAFRRQSALDVGAYDPACITGEDCDLCVRLSAADYRLFLSDRAKVRHHNPTTVGHLIRQWYGYGRYHPYVFAKHNPKALELYLRLRRPIHGERYGCAFYRLAPVAVVVFLTRFLAMGGLAAVALGCALLGWSVPALVFGALAAGAALAYAWPDLRRAGLVRGGVFAALRMLADAALFAGAFLGGLRHRMIYLSATID